MGAGLDAGGLAMTMDGDPTPGFPWIMTTNLLTAVEYSLIMPTGFEYLQGMGGSEFFYGTTIAAFPVGRLCCLLPIGHWADRCGCRYPFRLTFVLGAVGSFMYGCASACSCKWLALAGRFLSGCGATGPLSAWTARAYTPDKRVRNESYQKMAQLFGVIVGPCINILFVHLDVVALDGWLLLNPGTCAGYFPCLCNVILLLGFWAFVAEPPLQAAGGSDAQPFKRLWSSGVWTCLVLAFGTNMQIAALDTMVSPITSARLGWDLTKNSAMFACIALLSLSGALASIAADRHKVGSLWMILIGSGGNVVCSSVMVACLLVGWERCSVAALMVSSAIMLIFVMFYAGPTSGTYQQACGDAQGLLGGLFTMAYAAGRPFGSILGGAALAGYPFPLSCLLALSVFASFFLPYCYRHRLRDTVRQALLHPGSRRIDEEA